ncbi:DUF3048 domain-containing protein [Microaerobacter geothermalis]|uniref:DUF3048 domain-containing protein n=1 Tax=Microaerobacter geothermalis TaxID=674972 RepID=UPI001F15CC10|nr:DUF3048 domain-containing protein [Microaerobacter geothermalis]MCF6094475.1 DUF3048 domain-containing protein [Microaerobacter geothermalis]
MKKVPVLFLFLILAIFVLSACGNKETNAPSKETETVVVNPGEKEQQTDNSQQTEEKTEENPVEEKPILPFTAPLTGIGSEVELKDRVVMVMINNHPKARPQFGLSQADIVYEVLAEGQITRFAAMYQSQSPEVIGPIRSIRPYYIDLGVGYDAIMVHSGGSPSALDLLSSKGYAHLDEIYNAGAYFWRSKNRKPPHNLYSSMEKIRQASKDKGFRENTSIPTFPFIDEDQEASGDKAEKIKVVYGSLYELGYEYNPETKKYKRFTEQEAHIDLSTNTQIEVTNILVVEAFHRVLDNEGRRAIDLFKGGKGYLFQRGKVQEVDWKNVRGIIRAYKDGKELGLYPGNTWVNIIPDVPGIKTSVTFE